MLRALALANVTRETVDEIFFQNHLESAAASKALPKGLFCAGSISMRNRRVQPTCNIFAR